MNEIFQPKLDLDALFAFTVVARERNMRKAAQLLNISQPPLSRKIRQLEENLGIVLFNRRSDGMELTQEGRNVLSIIYPLLEHSSEISTQLSELVQSGNNRATLGLTTAFEQAIFSPYLKFWVEEFSDSASVVRKESPKLVKDVSQGKIAAAFVALPLDTSDLFIFELNYSEKLLAVIPSCWFKEDSDFISFEQLHNKPLFWFKRKINPSYFDYIMNVFNTNKYSPIFLEEPYEYDVLLARISFGEGWALLPESYKAIPRNGIKFVYLNKSYNLSISLGYVYKDTKYFIKNMLHRNI